MKDKKYILKVTERHAAFGDKHEYLCEDGSRLYALLDELLRLRNANEFTFIVEQVEELPNDVD